VLDELAKATGECPGVIRIEGHTDLLGAPQHNLALSQARAESVREALIERGVAASRLRAQGFGADQPLADNRGAEGRAKNRRIEFRVANDTP
jgi:outer membrane protein OmpA-like peptidoglycan-associated protein